MKIRMNTLAAGPQGVLLAGQVYEVSPEVGRDLIAGSYAAPVSETAAAAPSQRETAEAKRPGAETATNPKVVAGPAPSAAELKGMNAVQLAALAAERGIDLKGASRKGAMLKIVEDALAAQE
jgi:hypothetical protein